MYLRKNLFIIRLLHRCIAVISVGAILCLSLQAQASLKEMYKNKDYKAIQSYFETLTRPANYQDYAYLILVHKKLNEVNELIATLEKATKRFPEKDVLQRELSRAYEMKSNSYSRAKKFEKVKQDYFVKAIKILDELKENKPTPANLTAFIHFYIRNENFPEAASILDMYSRKYKRGKNYFTLLCEVQFKQEQYGDAIKNCGHIVENGWKRDDSYIYYVESLRKMGEEQQAVKELKTLPGRFPASAQVHLKLAKQYIEENKSEKALEHLNKHISIDPSDEGLVLSAEEHFKMKDYDMALKRYIQACEQHKEPRKPLVLKLRKASQIIPTIHPLAEKYRLEVDRCKYQRRFEKQVSQTKFK